MTHVDDGTLVRWLDGEIGPSEREDTARHLEACESCGARLATIQQRSDLVRFMLRRADVEQETAAVRPSVGDPHPLAPSPLRERGNAHARSRRAWRLGSAAAAAVLVVTVITVEPVRAWVVQRVVTAWSLVRGSSDPVETPVVYDSAQARPVRRGSVAFVPAGDVFVLHVANRQAAGRLSIHRSDDETAVAEIHGDDGGESLVVLPTGMRIVNSAASRADYDLRLPSTVAQIFVTISDEPATRLLPDRGTERWDVSLGQIPPER